MERSPDAVGQETRVVLENCGRIDPGSLEQALEVGAYSALRAALKDKTPSDVTAVVKDSGLRGRGGAGFPTGLKWAYTAAGETKYVVCNADEGEPGTFKDRLILEGDPHRVLEGMAIAAYAVGASQGYVYIRGEYGQSIACIEKAIRNARAAGYLGRDILGSQFSFDVEVKKGAGSYVCGDETALLESMEGKRGYPRIKPPFPGTAGFWDKPTVVNNVETLANVPPILLRGAKWFRSLGSEKSPGTKVFLLLGDVAQPKAVEVPMGTTLRTLLKDFAGGIRNGKRFKAALLGGAAGTIVGADALDMALDFDAPKAYGAVLGSGSVLVLDEDASIVGLLDNLLRFFRHESCGQCTPCRSGTAALVTLSERIQAGRGSAADLEQLVSLAAAMQATSLCPLGQSPILPVKTAVEGFRGEFEACLASPCSAGA